MLRVVERYLACADEFLRSQPQNGYDVYGNPLQCRASTRKGTPCQRMPLPHNGYCPSHQHLAETEELDTALAATCFWSGPAQRGPCFAQRRYLALMLLGVDVGGTFTDAVLAVDGRLIDRQVPDHAR